MNQNSDTTHGQALGSTLNHTTEVTRISNSSDHFEDSSSNVDESLDSSNPSSNEKASHTNEEYRSKGNQSYVPSSSNEPSPESSSNSDSSSSDDSSVDRLAGDPFELGENFNLKHYLRAYKDSLQRDDIITRSSGVCMRDHSVYGVGSGYEFLKTFPDIFLQPYRAITEKQVVEKAILSHCHALANAGELVMVLGQPGSGCSTFLRSVTSDTVHYKRVEGTTHYDGIDKADMKKFFPGDLLYSGENDVHFPSLTTAETLDFAAKCRTPNNRPCNLTRQEYVSRERHLIATAFGLTHTFNTKVGNDFVRGVSGGERKRVTISEGFATRPTIACWDNSTRGLDSSTAFEFVNVLRTCANELKMTSFVTAYQASEKIYKLFDRICVLYAGRQIYYGPADKAKQYFLDMGFDCHPRETTPDFLTAISDPKARFPRKGFENRVPRTPDEFEQMWRNSSVYADLMAEMESYDKRWTETTPASSEAPEKDNFGSDISATTKHELYRQSAVAEKSKRVKDTSPYTVTFSQQLWYCLARSWERYINDPAYIGSMAFAFLFQSLIIGSIFYDMKLNTVDVFSRGGVLFFSILFCALQSLSEIANMFSQRPIIAKHRASALYHPAADVISSLIVDLPFRFINISVFSIVLYFLTNLKRTAGGFWTYFLFLFIGATCMSAFFRSLAGIMPNVESASALGGIGVLAIAIYTGYAIPNIDVGWWFRWIAYLDPLQFGFESLMINEFKARQFECSQLIPYGSGYDNYPVANKICPVTSAEPGTDYVDGSTYLYISFNYKTRQLWRNLAIIIGYYAFLVFVNIVASETLNFNDLKGEYLVFRRGHAPDAVKAAVNEGGKPLDLETGQDTQGGDVVKESPDNEEELNKEYEGIEKGHDIFSWRNLNYDIQIKGEHRRLLNGVQGFVVPGKLTALMGESGAGKTTLLNVLAQRVDTGVVTGDMLVNGRGLDSTFQRRTGYVQQQDVHIGESTVREALRFSAALRQPASVPLSEKYEYVESVIKLLEMESYAEAIIGTPGSGLNVEQRKRATIGVELAAKPALLLFLDEPTSGLDSQSAWSIVCFLRKLADAGQAILCTIHQPSAVLFDQFDRLLLLQKGGKTVYFGDIGEHSKTLLNYFESHGAVHCPDDGNPAEYILDVIGAGATATTNRDWHEVWNNSEERKAISAELDKINASFSNSEDKKTLSKEDRSTYAMPLWFQVKMVMTRNFQSYWREPSILMSKLALDIFAGLFIGFTFYNQGLGVQNIQNKLFAVFMATVLAVPLINGLQPKFIELRNVFEVREKPSNIYSWVAFVFSAIIVEIPFNLVFGTLFFLCWFYPIKFYKHIHHPGDKTGYAWLLYMFFQMYFSTFGQAVASACPNAQTASVVNSLLFTFVITFNGVLQPNSNLVGFWHWMHSLTPFTYLIEGLLSDLVHGLPVECKSHEMLTINPPSGQTCGEYMSAFLTNNTAAGNLLNPNATTSCSYCPYQTADQFLERFSMRYTHRWRNLGIFVGYVFFNIFAVLLLFYVFRVMKLRSTWLGKKITGTG
ncbi:plasma membrane brefeldin A efflux transporter Bfr1 [Schizosaccharomyces pombe]|uniref:Brefeldin A resistance protein n=1 Tax=Schizosaccharomyces pombe (strain 972 / ATCC 24843) TaxID=284812 RepID=BFR1_SCHPO|nr:brefeldin A efflux transporter Bfr1 [Schizosaccharomyces pombe]P41820.1 RecName: Full=Brefeldin A resistance protein [Schizosaccharomyces pombe 972h-]CAA58062.1 hba2 [Schizosaccharomyces pombe]CAC34990.2 brefeldin A efflux transporter Bfr1 [Schizosaccharomyces pombe]|eukprot:NP_587932.3 brefeldin A efflux transporter Bfr1 [Schizosaccharomyces pombe]